MTMRAENLRLGNGEIPQRVYEDAPDPRSRVHWPEDVSPPPRRFWYTLSRNVLGI
jgi:hypothetical protein